MKINEVKDILERNAITVEDKKVIKNGIELDALMLGDGKVKPTIYQSTIEHIDSEDELLEYIYGILDTKPEIEIGTLTDKGFVMEHVKSCIRHASADESIVKFSAYGDLEEYFRVDLGELDGNRMSVVVTPELLKHAGIAADELQNAARDNLKKDVVIKSMREVLAESMGVDPMDIPIESTPMYVISNQSKSHGAASILCEDVLHDFCKERNIEKLCIIPSSIHESILIPEDVADVDTVNQMIDSVNEETVDALDQLSNHCYFYSVA